MEWDFYRFRDIVEEPTFVEQANLISPDIERFDEIMDGVKWALARNPEMFPRVLEGMNLHIAKTDSWGDIPALRILFRYDDNETRLLWVEPIPHEEDEQVHLEEGEG